MRWDQYIQEDKLQSVGADFPVRSLCYQRGARGLSGVCLVQSKALQKFSSPSTGASPSFLTTEGAERERESRPNKLKLAFVVTPPKNSVV